MYRNLRISVALAAVLAVAAGCPMTTPTGAVNFSATLDGSQEVPPVVTAASGSGTLMLNESRTELSFSIIASGLSGTVTGAHFHRGPMGEDGPVVQDITSMVVESGGQVTLEGVWQVNENDVEELLDGNIYVNLHTAINPDGEIRATIQQN